MSDEAELEALLRQLIVDWENEVVEFKAAGEDYSTGTIGKYFGLRVKMCVWLGVSRGLDLAFLNAD